MQVLLSFWALLWAVLGPGQDVLYRGQSYPGWVLPWADGMQDLISHMLQLRACELVLCSLFESSFSGGVGMHLVGFWPGWAQVLFGA